MLSFFPQDVLDEIWDLIGSVSGSFLPTFSNKDIEIINFLRRFQSFIGGILT